MTMTVVAAREALKKYFGYDQFRPMQEEIIQAVYNKEDCLVLMPTGGGKSICYQIPAITSDGLCIVVSPLISLMKDQVEGLKANGVAAAFLNSSLSSAEQQMIEDEVYHGRIKLLYVSPEKMVSESFLPLLKQSRVRLLAIDEAHCISSWGHDFRPEYKQMRFLKKQFPEVPIIALTATADKVTRRDIVEQLQLADPKVFVASFDRPNLSLTVRPGQKRREQILDFIKQRPQQAGIIYCLSRKSTEEVAKKLQEQGLKAGFYHAGMDPARRNKVQEDFINDNLLIVCATIAFGMGIDKSNVRWVIHYNLPKNIEGYYQEIGRAGRDGTKADTMVFYSFRDVTVMREILQSNRSENIEVQLSKLERMQQYAEAMVCRRKILLSYFGENLEENCGNCDVCKNPPQYFDGTILAQKALSAVARMGERVGIRMLIDVLRGSNRKDILAYGYDKIKTYGMGADIPFNDWQHLMLQMINLGLLEIAYDQNNTLKLNDASKEVLFNNRKVQLIKMADVKQRQEERRKKVVVKTQRERVRDELFESLRKLRRELAQERGVPPYLIFSDATLEEMAARRPISEYEMGTVSGVGEKKMQLYGHVFINAILSFIQKKKQVGVKVKVDTQQMTLQLYKRGLSLQEIALERELSEQTIQSHLVKLYAAGAGVDHKHFVKKAEINRVVEVVQSLGTEYKLREIFDALNEEISYVKIQFALAYYYKHSGEQV